jgi:hypothetical protein
VLDAIYRSQLATISAPKPSLKEYSMPSRRALVPESRQPVPAEPADFYFHF